MHILYFSGVKLPSKSAASIHVMKMAQAFAVAGHHVELYAKGKVGASKKRIFKRYAIEKPFTLHLSPFIKVPVYTHSKPLRQLSKRKPKIKIRRPDLVFGRDPVALALFCPSNIPVIFETDAMPYGKHYNWAFLKLLHQPNFRGIVTQSDALKTALLLRYEELGGEQVFVAHDGADLREYIASHARDTKLLKGRPDALKVGYAGSLYPGKGVEIIERIAKICPEYDFHVVGGTKWQLHKYHTKQLPKNLFFYGYKKHAEIPSYLKAFDIVVAPYQHHALIRTGKNVSRWISPMKLFEYMAAEKPIICSDLPQITEILTDKRNALLTAPSDEKKWAEKIRYLHQNPEITQQLAQQALIDAKGKYTWDQRAHAIVKFFVRSEKLQHHIRYMEFHTAEIMRKKQSSIRM